MKKLLLLFVMMFGLTSYGQNDRIASDNYDTYIVYQGNKEVVKGYTTNIVVDVRQPNPYRADFYAYFSIDNILNSKEYRVKDVITYQSDTEEYKRITTYEGVSFYEYLNGRLTIIEESKSGYMIYLFDSSHYDSGGKRIIPNKSDKIIKVI